MKNSRIGGKELSQVSDFLIYFIMYIFTCYIGTVFVNFALHNSFTIVVLGFRFQGAIVLSLIFLAIIAMLLSELNKYKQSIIEILIKIFGSESKNSTSDKEVLEGLGNLLMALVLLPFLFTSWTYFYPITHEYTIFVVLIIFGIIYYLIFTFLKSLKIEIEKGVVRLYNYLKKKKEELEREEEK
jgi:hypothetical protein